MVRNLDRARAWPGHGLMWTAIAMIAVYGLIFLLMIPRVYSGDGRSSRVLTALGDERKIAASVKKFKADCGRYPTTQEGLNALTQRPRGMKNWHGPYSSIPLDPWDHPFSYATTRDGFRITSFGSDGHPGGARRAADIVTRF